jgi:hypothetical protein
VRQHQRACAAVTLSRVQIGVQSLQLHLRHRKQERPHDRDPGIAPVGRRRSSGSLATIPAQHGEGLAFFPERPLRLPIPLAVLPATPSRAHLTRNCHRSIDLPRCAISGRCGAILPVGTKHRGAQALPTTVTAAATVAPCDCRYACLWDAPRHMKVRCWSARARLRLTTAAHADATKGQILAIKHLGDDYDTQQSSA